MGPVLEQMWWQKYDDDDDDETGLYFEWWQKYDDDDDDETGLYFETPLNDEQHRIGWNRMAHKKIS